jgi:hypothetical protein
VSGGKVVLDFYHIEIYQQRAIKERKEQKEKGFQRNFTKKQMH